jgi:hypothetical protein
MRERNARMRKNASRPDAENPEWAPGEVQNAQRLTGGPAEGDCRGTAALSRAARSPEEPHEGAHQPARRSRRCGGIPGDRPRVAESSRRGAAPVCPEGRALDRARLQSTWCRRSGPSSRSPDGFTLIVARLNGGA